MEPQLLATQTRTPKPRTFQVTPDGRLRLGVAGLGVASTLFLPSVEQHPHTDIVAAADTRPKRSSLPRTLRGRTYDNVEELCADPASTSLGRDAEHISSHRMSCLAAEHGEACHLHEADGVDGRRMRARCATPPRERRCAAVRTDVQHVVGHSSDGEVVASGRLGRVIAMTRW